MFLTKQKDAHRIILFEEVSQKMAKQEADILEVAPENVNFHSTLPTQVAIIKSTEQLISPKSSIEDYNRIEFEVSSQLNRSIDLQATRLVMETQIVDEKGQIIPSKTPIVKQGDVAADNPDAQAVPINGINHAVFKGLTVKLNHRELTATESTYHVRGDISTRIRHNVSMKQKYMVKEGFFEESKTFDEYPDGTKIENMDEAIVARHEQYKDGKIVKTIGPIHHEIFEQGKLLQPGSRLDLFFERNTNQELLIMSKKQNVRARLVVKKCQLLVKYVELDPKLVNDAAYLTTHKGKNVILPITKVEVNYFTKQAGCRDISEQNILPEGKPLPRRLFVTWTSQKAFFGNYKHDIFRYQRFNINHIELKIGGESRPYTAIKMESKNDYIMAYEAFAKATNSQIGEVEHPLIEYGSSYVNRNFIVGWDLSPSGEAPGDYFELPTVEDTFLEVTCSEPLADNIVMITYAEYDAEIEIDANKNPTIKTE